MCFKKVRAIFPNRVSTMLSHDPWVGVSTYRNRFGRVARYAWVSLEMWAEWLSMIRRMLHSAG